ncbi:hypothetical protein [Parafrankia discariae]|uniref:hypothetical protein n=1 Tax=Parafrankia discariae TaxID=365528 RepID=UPI000370B1BF|nr:hypothetical protein [Parafrankia discariae]
MNDEELDQWLASARRDLTQDLAATLDVEAGLRDALLPTRHAVFVNDLRAVLDLDAGLAAILPAVETTGHTQPESPTTPTAFALSTGQMGATARLLRLLPPGDRIVLRGNSAITVLAVSFQVAFTQTYAHDLARDLDRARPPDHLLPLAFARPRAIELVRDLDRALALALALNLELASDLDLARDRARDLVRFLPHDPVRARFHLRGLADALDHAIILTFERARERADALESASRGARVLAHAIHSDLDDILGAGSTSPGNLPRDLDLALSDFTEADLREVDLAGLPLTGIRWSPATTRWPPDWQTRIESRSEEIEPGVFEIRDGTAHADTSTSFVDL